MKLHLSKAHVIDPVTGTDAILDLRIADGRIERMGPGLPQERGFEVIDMTGKIVTPGLMDMHVHLREPGFEHKETIATGCAAAAAGGFTAIACMPNTNPAIDDESVARYVQEQGRRAANGVVDVLPIGAATKGRSGEELAPFAELAEAGAIGFSDDGAPIASAEIMRRVLEYASMYDLPVIQHAEEPTMVRGGCMHEGSVSLRLGLPGIPRVAEEIMIARDLILLRYIPRARYHVAHISTAESVDLIRRAKAQGLNVTCEVTPHHFTLTDEAVEGYDTNTKMNPPLRPREDVEALKEGLKDGTIDVIATDHAPHTVDEKEVEYTAAPFGIIGLETALGLALTELVHTKVLTLSQLIGKLSTNPRRITSRPPIRLEQGAPANLTLIDPDIEWIVDRGTSHSKSQNSPFGGRRLKGGAIGIINHGMYVSAG